MNSKPKKKDKLEISSDQLKAELIEIKERIDAIETISSISNRKVVEDYVRGHVKTDKAKQIMAFCAQPRGRDQLRAELKLPSQQALDHHIRPLREADLLRRSFDEAGNMKLEWGNLFRRLPSATIKKILDGKD